MPLHLIGRLESFDADFREVACRAGIAGTVQPLNVTGPHPLDQWITEPLRRKIYAAYREDFERFRYPEALLS